MQGEVTGGNEHINVHATGNEKYPLLPGTPGITFDFNISLETKDGKTSAVISGAHDGFPAYEILVTRRGWDKPQVIYSHDPRETGQTLLSLFPRMEFTVAGRVHTLPPEGH